MYGCVLQLYVLHLCNMPAGSSGAEWLLRFSRGTAKLGKMGSPVHLREVLQSGSTFRILHTLDVSAAMMQYNPVLPSSPLPPLLSPPIFLPLPSSPSPHLPPPLHPISFPSPPHPSAHLIVYVVITRVAPHREVSKGQ